MTTPITPPAPDLSRQALRTAFWAYSSLVAGKAVSFVSSIILARLLFPQEFGVFSICLIVLSYLEIVATGGTEGALIARRDRIQETANSAFVLNICLGLVCLGLAWILAPAVALFFHSNSVTELLRALSLALPIMALGVVPDALLQRHLRFRARVLPDAASSLTKALVSIALALAGYGVWSLVFGQIAGEVTATALAWLLAHWRPTRHFSRESTSKMLSFSGHMIMIGLVVALLGNLDYIFVGRILGTADLGWYTLAFRLPELLIGQFAWAVGRAAFPLIATVNSNPGFLRSAYLKYVRYISLFSFPLGAGLALLAAPFILLFYTSRWEQSIQPMELISCAMAISSVGFMAGVLYKALNRPHVLNLIMLVRLPIAIVLLWYGTQRGIVGVALAQCFLAAIFVIIDCVIISRILRFQLSRVFVAIQPALLGTLVLALVVGGLRFFLSPTGLGSIVIFVLGGTAIYLGTLMLVSRETVQEARFVLVSALMRP